MMLLSTHKRKKSQMLFGNIENVSSFPTSKPAVDLRDPKFGQVIAERRFISVSEAAAVTLGGS